MNNSKYLKLTLEDIQLGTQQQIHYYWLYCWSRHKGGVYVEDQITRDRFLWIPR